MSYQEDCAFDFGLDIVTPKWNVNIILELITEIADDDTGSLSFSEITARIPEISPRMLSMRLSSLIEEGVVIKIDNEEKPKKVRYKLAKMGWELAEVLKLLREWSLKYGKCDNQICISNECKHGKAITKLIKLQVK